jgi:hypothetical protein
MAEEATLPADPPLPASPRVSSLAAFARTLVLPVEFPLRLLLCGPIAAALAMTFVDHAVYGMPFILTTGNSASLWLTGILAIPFVVFGGCAWQRCIAGRAAEPIGHWLAQSLRRAPDYAVAVVAALLPSALIWSFFCGMAYLILEGGNLTEVATGWWALAGLLLLLLPGLWLFARLSFLPVIVATEGWRGAGERCWNLGRGRDFGLVLGYTFFLVVGFILTGFTSFLFFRLVMAVVEMTEDFRVYASLIEYTYLAGQAVGVTFLGAWVMGFPALIARQDARPVEINLATFD